MAVQVIVMTRIFKLTHHILSEIRSLSTNQTKAFSPVLLVIDSRSALILESKRVVIFLMCWHKQEHCVPASHQQRSKNANQKKQWKMTEARASCGKWCALEVTVQWNAWTHQNSTIHHGAPIFSTQKWPHKARRCNPVEHTMKILKCNHQCDWVKTICSFSMILRDHRHGRRLKMRSRGAKSSQDDRHHFWRSDHDEPFLHFRPPFTKKQGRGINLHAVKISKCNCQCSRLRLTPSTMTIIVSAAKFRSKNVPFSCAVSMSRNAETTHRHA